MPASWRGPRHERPVSLMRRLRRRYFRRSGRKSVRASGGPISMIKAEGQTRRHVIFFHKPGGIDRARRDAGDHGRSGAIHSKRRRWRLTAMRQSACTGRLRIWIGGRAWAGCCWARTRQCGLATGLPVPSMFLRPAARYTGVATRPAGLRKPPVRQIVTCEDGALRRG